MNITLNFDTSSKNDAALLSKLLDALALLPPINACAEPPAAGGEESETEIEQKKRGRKPKAEPAPLPPVVSGQEWRVPNPPEPSPVPEPVVEVQAQAEPELPLETNTVATATELTLDDVRGALQGYTAKHGVPAGIELLKKFDAGRISELNADQYAAFVEACGV